MGLGQSSTWMSDGEGDLFVADLHLWYMQCVKTWFRVYFLPSSCVPHVLSECLQLTAASTSSRNGGLRLASSFRLSVVISGRRAGAREKLYLLSSLLYHSLMPVKFLMLLPLALGWMLCMVAAMMVSKVWLVLKRFSKKADNFAFSISWSGQERRRR